MAGDDGKMLNALHLFGSLKRDAGGIVGRCDKIGRRKGTSLGGPFNH